jgi:hypothetical protein
METLINLHEKLNNIESEIDALKLNYNYKNGFDKKIDLQKFMNDNKLILEESNNLRKQIKILKWELMTQDEKADKKETVRKILTKTRTNLSQVEILEIINKTIEIDGGL